MNKWLLLILIVFCWAFAGLALFGEQRRGNKACAVMVNPFQRIVSTAPNVTEILFALGLGKNVAGVPLASNFPAEAAEKPKIGDFWQMNIEAVIGARPDLIITLGFQQQRNMAERLKRIGYQTLSVDVDNKISELFAAIKTIGEASGTQERADKLAADIKSQLDELSAKVRAKKDKVKVLYIVQAEPLRVAGRDTFINEMIEMAGGENAIGPTIYKYPPIGGEQIIASGTDVIIQPAMGEKDTAALQKKALSYWSRFVNLPAVKNKRIYIVDDDTISQPGPRVPQGVETIAKCLSPELFENSKSN